MTEPKFTPGSWKYANYTDFLEIQNADPVNPKEIAYIDDWTDEQEAAANAALIAAAPEMYARLERLVLSDEESRGEVLLKPWISEEIKSLLAKARGESESR